jgi:MoxR-like ATPase
MTYEPTLFKPPRRADGNANYVFSDRILVAIDVALAAGRPLLVTGNPGSGKTMLARAIASGLNWRLLARTVTSRTRLEDLEADLDTLRRLSDAQLRLPHGLPPDWTYLRPGVFWWAFNRATAHQRGASADEIKALVAAGHRIPDALSDPSEGNTATADVVVLLDEIDKADPDLPNDLLEPLDRRRFSLQMIERRAIRAAEGVKVMLIMTSNGERELPAAFLRRCVALDLPDARSESEGVLKPGEISLEQIAQSHFGKGAEALFRKVAADVVSLRKEAARRGTRPPSTAEYLDTVRALSEVPGLKGDEVWSLVRQLLMLKSAGAGDP